MKNKFLYLTLILYLFSGNIFSQNYHSPIDQKEIYNNHKNYPLHSKNKSHRKLNNYKTNISHEQIKNISHVR